MCVSYLVFSFHVFTIYFDCCHCFLLTIQLVSVQFFLFSLLRIQLSPVCGLCSITYYQQLLERITYHGNSNKPWRTFLKVRWHSLPNTRLLILCFSSFHFQNSGSEQLQYAALLGRTSNQLYSEQHGSHCLRSTPVDYLSALLTRCSRTFPEIVGEVRPPQKYFNFRKTKIWEELLNY